MPLTQALLTHNERSSNQSILAGWPYWLALSLIMAAGFFLRIAHLTVKPFWFDESFSVELARLNWSNFLQVLWWREANMTLYYLLLRAWLHLGQSEFFIRSLSVVLSAATMPAIYWLANLLYDRRVALLASALFAFNAYSLRYAQEARSYALFVLLATLSSGFLVSWLDQSSNRNRSAYILTSVLAVYAHLYALLLVVAHCLTVRSFGLPNGNARTESDLSQIRRAWGMIGLASLPLLAFVAKTGAGPIRWIRRPGIHDLWAFAEQFAGAGGWPLLLLYAIACVGGVIPALKHSRQRNRDPEIWRVHFLLVWLAFPIFLTVLLSFARPVFLGRYMIFCLPALVILAASGLTRLRPTWLLVAVTTVVLLLSANGVFYVYSHDFDQERDGSAAAANFILDHAQPGDGIIFDIAEARVPYEFFRSRRAGQDTAKPTFTSLLGPEILFPHTGAGLQFQDFKAKLSPDTVRAMEPAHSRIWIFLIYNETSGKPDAATAMLTQTLPGRFPHMQRWQFPRVELRLYSKD